MASDISKRLTEIKKGLKTKITLADEESIITENKWLRINLK